MFQKGNIIMKKLVIIAALLVPTPAIAQGCWHDQHGGNCSDRNGHGRRNSDWKPDGGHGRAKSDWKPVHDRSASNRHTRANSNRDR
jgi:hypothetical protein